MSVYRITVRSNPRILVIYILMPVLLAAGAGAIFLLGIIFGFIALAAAGFLVWSMLKLTRRQLATRVQTFTDEILFVMHGDEKVSFPWEKIRIAGMAVEQDEKGRMRTKERRPTALIAIAIWLGLVAINVMPFTTTDGLLYNGYVNRILFGLFAALPVLGYLESSDRAKAWLARWLLQWEKTP